MTNNKGPPIASILPTTKIGDHNYAILKIDHTAAAPLTTTTTAIDNSTTTILCTSSIPFHISIPEFLNFVAPVDSFVSHYRVIR
jgi:BRCA1-associated protein